MISVDTIPILLLAGVAALVVAGLVTATVGVRLPRRGDWLIGVPLVYLLVVAIVAWNGLSEDHFSPHYWSRGWIWPRGEVGAITIGVMLEPLGIVMAALGVLLAGLLLADLRERSPKAFGAIAVSAAGVVLAWTALTPWISFCGLGLAIFGGFLSMGERWVEESGATAAARFAWERCWGILISVFGLCTLAGPRAALEFSGASWIVSSNAAAEVAGGAAGTPADWIGMSLLFLGLWVQFQPFPFIGELVTRSGQPAPMRVLLRQVFPAWCAFALLLRIAPHFDATSPFFTVDWQILGWASFVSAVLAVASGLVHSDWKTSLSLWVSASFLASIGALSTAGPAPATALLLGASLGAFVLAKSGEALEGKIDDAVVVKKSSKSKKEKEEEKTAEVPAASRATWFRVAAVLGAASATGMFGFVSAGGALGTLAVNLEQPAVLAAAAVVFLLNTVLCWSFVWKIGKRGAPVRSSWLTIAVTFLVALLSLGLFWTGTASGGALPGSPDALLRSLFAILFGGATTVETAREPDPSAFVTASGVHWGALVVGLLVAGFVFGRKAERAPFAERSPRFADFLTSGYGVDRGLARVRASLVVAADALESLLNQSLWKKGLPAIFAPAIRGTARAAMALDGWIAEGLDTAVRRGVEAPAKALQYIQNGDVRWYLFFAVGSGFLILLHFAGVTG